MIGWSQTVLNGNAVNWMVGWKSGGWTDGWMEVFVLGRSYGTENLFNVSGKIVEMQG